MFPFPVHDINIVLQIYDPTPMHWECGHIYRPKPVYLRNLPAKLIRKMAL